MLQLIRGMNSITFFIYIILPGKIALAKTSRKKKIYYGDYTKDEASGMWNESSRLSTKPEWFTYYRKRITFCVIDSGYNDPPCSGNLLPPSPLLFFFYISHLHLFFEEGSPVWNNNNNNVDIIWGALSLEKRGQLDGAQRYRGSGKGPIHPRCGQIGGEIGWKEC